MSNSTVIPALQPYDIKDLGGTIGTATLAFLGKTLLTQRYFVVNTHSLQSIRIEY